MEYSTILRTEIFWRKKIEKSKNQRRERRTYNIITPQMIQLQTDADFKKKGFLIDWYEINSELYWPKKTKRAQWGTPCKILVG